MNHDEEGKSRVSLFNPLPRCADSGCALRGKDRPDMGIAVHVHGSRRRDGRCGVYAIREDHPVTGNGDDMTNQTQETPVSPALGDGRTDVAVGQTVYTVILPSAVIVGAKVTRINGYRLCLDGWGWRADGVCFSTPEAADRIAASYYRMLRIANQVAGSYTLTYHFKTREVAARVQVMSTR